MDIHFKSNTESISKELQSYASMKLGRLPRYLDKIKSVSVNFTAGNSKHKATAFRCDVHVAAPGHDVHASAESNSFRAAVDTCMESLKTQLAKFAEKRVTKQRDDASVAKARRTTQLRERPAVPWDASEHRFQTEHYSLKPRDVQDAITELKSNGADVLVFVNQSGIVNAVVRRGRRVVLLEPEVTK